MAIVIFICCISGSKNLPLLQGYVWYGSISGEAYATIIGSHVVADMEANSIDGVTKVYVQLDQDITVGMLSVSVLYHILHPQLWPEVLALLLF